ncbi:restriction endonuclease subunit S [Megasphaera elsdenii]|uniref:restriction endonuclease subunit S n=1 Tax=Megasphaera elsdenii TaxID=907 RepID=UPI001D032821|nr:restriction endonuclease subunit S [Megasphaera elsdenii]MCB5701921.1 restriction endonuclease subunit S [Megasphaera elsdenii]MCB5726723.1 restriction endonuclease subunit S [Megasphaera elsdenii]MCB5770502.1 restriction endonuclease subunit S [Megasphaera elsdenii]
MRKEIKKAPTIRFQGFTDEWEQRKLGELAGKTYGGGTPRTSEKTFWNGQVPWFQSSDLIEDKVLSAIPKKKITEKGLQKSAAQLIPENSIAIITRVGVGKLAFIPFSYSTSQDFLSLSALNIDGKFGCYSIYKLLQREKNLTQGTSIKGITKKELLRKILWIPCQDEQIKIGRYIANIDNLITLHQRKLDQLKTLKKYFLQNMFPAKGEKVPRIRFKGFTGDWEQRKVTELGYIYIGLVTTMTSHYSNHGTLLIRNSDIKDSCFEFDKKPIFLDEEFAKQNASRRHQVGDVITVHTGDIGTSAVITEKEEGSIGFATIVTRPYKEKITSEYLCTYLNTDTHKNFALNISTGDGRNNYNLKDYYECGVPVPRIKEQIKIADFINALNNLITLHQQKLNQLQTMKKFMLQNLFI